MDGTVNIYTHTVFVDYTPHTEMIHVFVFCTKSSPIGLRVEMSYITHHCFHNPSLHVGMSGLDLGRIVKGTIEAHKMKKSEKPLKSIMVDSNSMTISIKNTLNQFISLFVRILSISYNGC